MMVKRSDITAEARKHLGTRWLHQGRRVGVGLDCLGLIVTVARALGYPVEDTTTYDLRPDPTLLLAEVKRQLIPVAPADVRPGTILLLHFNPITKTAYHFAILAEDDRIIHGYAKARRVVEDCYSESWAHRLTAAFDFPGLED